MSRILGKILTDILSDTEKDPRLIAAYSTASNVSFMSSERGQKFWFISSPFFPFKNSISKTGSNNCSNNIVMIFYLLF